MFKTALNKNIIPYTWKLANIVPIPKPNKDTVNGTSYRPISLLSVIAMTLEKSLLPYMTANILNTPMQHGYKTQHSTVTELHTLNNTVAKGFNKMALTAQTITVALDTINIHTLIRKQLQTNDTAYKRWSCHSGRKLLCKLCRTSPPPAIGARFTIFLACRPCGPAGWLALLLTKADDVETNPGPTTLNKKVWICDICHQQIHVRKQISIRCNSIERWVHLRCAGTR